MKAFPVWVSPLSSEPGRDRPVDIVATFFEFPSPERPFFSGFSHGFERRVELCLFMHGCCELAAAAATVSAVGGGEPIFSHLSR